MKIGITGHQELPHPGTWNWVRDRIAEVLAIQGEACRGYSSLAKGADQLFAELILEHGGSLHVIIPFRGYERTFEGPALIQYRALLKKASKEVLYRDESDEDAYLAAGKRIVDSVDVLIAVWNGLPAKGKGGTADIARYSEFRKIPLIHINPSDQSVRTQDAWSSRLINGSAKPKRRNSSLRR